MRLRIAGLRATTLTAPATPELASFAHAAAEGISPALEARPGTATRKHHPASRPGPPREGPLARSCSNDLITSQGQTWPSVAAEADPAGPARTAIGSPAKDHLANLTSPTR